MKSFDERMQSIAGKAETMKKANRRKGIFAISTVATLCLAVGLYLFVPFSWFQPNAVPPAGEPYRELIAALQKYASSDGYRNNYEIFMESIETDDKVTSAVPEADSNMNSGAAMESTAAPGQYAEVTDNQVAGVIEADLFKRTNSHIFYMTRNELYVYSIAQENSECVNKMAFLGILPTTTRDNTDTPIPKEGYYGTYAREMFLSADGKMLTVFLDAMCYEKDGIDTVVVNLDVSDPENIQVAGKLLLSGGYATARQVDGSLIVSTRAYLSRNALDFDKEQTFLPQYGWVDELKSVPAEDIVLPEALTSLCYQNIWKLDANTLTMQDSKSLLSYGKCFYASRDNLFVPYSYRDDTCSKTDLTGICYSGKGLELLGTITIDGTIADQYAMDEHEGILRVVTTTHKYTPIYLSGKITDYVSEKINSTNLYCISLKKWDILGKVESFAPEGEEAVSVRFDGTTAYVCTAEIITLTDPVYFFDLSDPANITWTDTGTIDGYSTSLVQFGENTLLGIGVDEDRLLKVEVYQEAQGKVESVACFGGKYSAVDSYKAYFIDRENGFVGIPAYSYETGDEVYLLLRYRDGELKLLEELRILQSEVSLENIRGTMINGWMYVVYNELMVVNCNG